MEDKIITKNNTQYVRKYKKVVDDLNYDPDIITLIRMIYVIGIILWIFILFGLHLITHKTDFFGWVILMIPIFVYIINIINISDCTYGAEKYLFKDNLISFGFLITAVLINWNSSCTPSQKAHFFKIIVLALILLMLGLLNIWTSKKMMTVVNNVRTILQTASLTLLVFALFSYYTDCEDL